MRVPESGYFVLRATATDRRGNEVRASTGLYAVSDRPDEDVSTRSNGWSEGDARVVKLELDKKNYAAGETARVLIRNPFKEAEALVTVERAGVLATQTTVVRGPMPVVSVPVRDDYFPDVFVSVHLVRGRVQAPPESGADIGGPDYRDGYVDLTVTPQSHRLDVDVIANKKEFRPGDDLDADIAVKDAYGRPTRAEVTFYAVDEGVLMLTDYKTPDPLEAFTGPRSLAVFGMESRDHLAKIRKLKAGEKLHDVGWETRVVNHVARDDSSDKGDPGGGGDEDSAGKVRRDFRNTAFFEAGRITSAEGKAHFHFKLPDNLTTFRLMAVAASVDRFGSGQANITASKSLMVRPALPRAIRLGDKFNASVVVSGKTLGPVSADVHIALGSAGLALLGPPTQRTVLPASGNAEVHFPLVARSAGDVKLSFDATAGAERDAVVVSKTVSTPLHLESTAVYGETDHSSAIALGDLSRIRSDKGGLDVRLSSSALVGLDAAFEELSDYPYGCTEQLASRMIPLVALGDLARTVGARVPAATDARMEDAVGELLAHQHADGGFGFWDDDPALPWLSAYAMFALDGASKKGIHVPSSALDYGIEYLRRALSGEKFKSATPVPRGRADETTSEDAVHAQEADREELDDKDAPLSGEGLTTTDRASRAYAEASFVADTLATLGKPDPGMLNQLYDERAHQPLFSQALLLHAMAVATMPKSQTGNLANEILSRLRVDAGVALADEENELFAPLLDSPVRTTALVLRALLAVDPAQPLAPRLAKGLLMARKTDAWRSTQENTWALVALDDYRKAQEAPRPDFDVNVFLGSTLIGDEAFHDRSLRDARITLPSTKVRELAGPLAMSLKGAGRLYYSAELKYEVAELPQKPLDRGLFVQKTMRAVKLSEIEKATKWIPKKTSLEAHAGDLVIVDLLLESPEPREQVVIVDPLPAGLEAVDFDLGTTGKTHAVRNPAAPGDLTAIADVPKDTVVDVGVPFRTTTFHRELKDDRVLTFLPAVKPGLYHFSYLARATVVGTYVVPPTSADCMYSPEVYGRTRAFTFDVVP